MATDRIKSTCESCGAISTVKAALIGKKTECPKCKFRYVVSDDAAGAVDGESKAGGKKGQGKGKKAPAKAKGGSNKVLVGALIGVLALAGLVVGAIMLFGGSGDDVAKNTGSGPAIQRPVTPPVGQNPEQPETPEQPENPDNPGGGTTDPINPEQPTIPAGPTPGVPQPTFTGADVTNLLPGSAKSVLHLKIDELNKAAGLVHTAMFDRVTADLFERSLKFRHTDLEEVLHCYVGTERMPYVLVRTKRDLPSDWVSNLDDTTRPELPIIQGKYQYRYLNSNPLITAIESSINAGDLFGLPIPGIIAKDVKYAAAMYDPRTVVVAERGVLEGFFKQLSPEGYPPYKTEYNEPVVSAEKPEGEAGSGTSSNNEEDEENRGSNSGRPNYSGSGGYGPPMGPGAGPVPGFPGGPPSPGIPGGPSGPRAPGGAPNDQGAVKPLKAITTIPTFRTIDPALKKAMNMMQVDQKPSAAATYAELIDQRTLNAAKMDKLIDGVSPTMILGLFSKAKVCGACISQLNEKGGKLSAYLDYRNGDAAKQAVTEQLMPALTLLRLYYFNQFSQQLAVINMNEVQTNPGSGGSGFPGGFPGSGGGRPGFPGGPPGGFPGGPPSGGIPGGPGAPSTPGGPGTGTGGGAGSGLGASLPRRHFNDNAQGPGVPGVPGVPGIPGGPPSGTGGPQYPGGAGGYPGGSGGYPGFPGGFGGSGTITSPDPNAKQSKIEVSRSDTTVMIQSDLLWERDAFDLTIKMALQRGGSVFRGKLGMFSGESSIFNLANHELNGRTEPAITLKAFERDGQLPTGALARTPERDRALPGGNEMLPYAPEDRCSFFVELLKFMNNKGTIYQQIDSKKHAWYSEKNLNAAESWIPELLVPDYSPADWRATNDLIQDRRSVGATNYVALAGVGLDAARYNPVDPKQAKKVGLMGYDFGSKAEDVKDGLSNTIFLIQTAPGLQRPWIAGGGATLMGVDESSPHPMKPFLHKRTNGAETTTVLMADGSVRTLRAGMDPAVFRMMVTRAGGEVIADMNNIAPLQQQPKRGQ